MIEISKEDLFEILLPLEAMLLANSLDRLHPDLRDQCYKAISIGRKHLLENTDLHSVTTYAV